MGNISKPVKIQLAIQGGGAKLVALLAAVEVIQELQNKKIEITNIAGTSAGAIAGALLAAQVPIPVVKKSLEGINPKDIAKNFPNPTWMSFVKLLAGNRTLWDTILIRERLHEFFDKQNVSKIEDVGKFGVKLNIIATNLTQNKAHPFAQDDDLIAAIIDSCGLPYFFKRWARDQENMVLVDGGICENLPSDYLEKDEKVHGDIIGISFRDKELKLSPNNVVDFTTSLLNTSISHSISRAKRNLGKNRVLELNTDINTFDFQMALTEGLKDKYDLIKIQTRDFFEQFLKRKSDEQTLAEKHSGEEPALVAELILAEKELTKVQFQENYGTLIGDIRKVYNLQHKPYLFKYKEMRLIVTANSLKNPELKDEVVLVLKFETGDIPLFCHEFVINTEKDEFVTYSVEFSVTDKNDKEIEVTSVISSINEDRFILFFNTPLPARTGIYTIVCKTVVSNFLSDNKISVSAFRASEAVGKVELILRIPKEGNRVTLQGNKGKPMKHKELMSIDTTATYNVLGWKGLNITTDVPFDAHVKHNN